MQHHTSEATPDTLQATDVDALVIGCNRFACDLYTQLAGQPGNLFYSPSSVSMALAMALAGADTETADEMARVLHATLPRIRVHEAFRKLREATATGGLELKIANRLWGQREYSFLPDYLDLTERCYGARLAEVDFETATEEARLEINAWVAEQTADRIRDLIAPDILDSMTRLILTNAIYFKGAWEKEFFAIATAVEPFRTGRGQPQVVPLMHRQGLFRYAEFDDFQVVELPYRSTAVDWQDSLVGGESRGTPAEIPGSGTNLAMNILLPRQIDGLAAIESRFSIASLQKWLTLEECRVDVALPKFKFESDFGLSDALNGLGMRRAFSELEADFSRMSDDPQGLCLQDVIHKAFVEVNEKGTEAAAATGCSVRVRCGHDFEPEPPKIFRADHPFLFLIRDLETGLIHFVARVVDPPVSEPATDRRRQVRDMSDAERREAREMRRAVRRMLGESPIDSEQGG